MISCIICSRSADIPQELKNNIVATIGCEYELVVIDNSTNKYTIFSAYNEGVHKAKGDVLCFMHEDIVYHTAEWGKKVEAYFAEESEYGLFGVIGGRFIPSTPSSYWEGGKGIGQIIQGATESGIYKTWISGRAIEQELQECAAVDGMWICVPKKMFDTIIWDTETYNHFHCYDLDICMQVRAAGKKIGVVRDIRIEHKSYGNTDAKYCEQSRLFFKKWENALPVVAGVDMSAEDIEERTRMVTYMRDNLEMACMLQRQLDGVHQSKAYRLGKTLLQPWTWVRKRKW